LVVLMFVVACTGDEDAPSTERAGNEPSASERRAGDRLTWRTLPPAPTARTEVTAATDGERILVVGGFDGSGDTISTVEIFDPATETWSSGPDLPVAVNHAMAAFLGGTFYVVGGYTGPGLSNPSQGVFGLRDDHWEELDPLPEPRAAGGAAAADGLLHIVGGVGPRGLADAAFVLDPARGRWETLEGPPTARQHLGVAGFEDQVFVVGGRTGGIGSNLQVAEGYDIASEQWQGLADMPTARGGIGATATANGFIVAPGGEADTTFEEVEAYDVAAAEWRSLPDMPTPRHGLGVVAVGSVVYTIAGGPEPGLSVSDAVEAIDLGPLR
jgi:non-specific serine/threonine protein kinase